MEKNKLVGKIISWSIYALIAAGVIVAFCFNEKIFGVNSVFNQVVSENQVVQYLYGTAIPALIRTVQIIVIAIALNLLLKLVAMLTFHSNKAITIARLLLNLAKWAIAIAAFFFILAAWGANATMMIASAGVLTLIIGLGSQALVADILAGVFIVFEGDFQVGDIVIIDGWRGEVQSIGIRTTKLIDAGGNIKIVNNSDIRSIVNQTKDLSVAKCYVGVNYGDRIENIEKVIADNLEKIKGKIPAIVEGPFYKGVSELADSAVVLLFVAKCKETDIYQVQRDLNREIKIVFDDNNVGIPFPQVTVSYDQGSDNDKVTKKVQKQVEEFVEEQKDLSKDIDDKK
ncbi:MAG: mechanosensitive ion channel family protein [Erysipelotrichaceae bacterium]|nr:mechanosensitive ion channel family protein [Erysipelotrichaceae bacterium]